MKVFNLVSAANQCVRMCAYTVGIHNITNKATRKPAHTRAKKHDFPTIISASDAEKNCKCLTGADCRTYCATPNDRTFRLRSSSSLPRLFRNGRMPLVRGGMGCG